MKISAIALDVPPQMIEPLYRAQRRQTCRHAVFDGQPRPAPDGAVEQFVDQLAIAGGGFACRLTLPEALPHGRAFPAQIPAIHQVFPRID